MNPTLAPKAMVRKEIARLYFELALAVSHLPTEVIFDPRLVKLLSDTHFKKINIDSTSQCIKKLKEKVA